MCLFVDDLSGLSEAHARSSVAGCLWMFPAPPRPDDRKAEDNPE